jgi:hypothetical protein
VHVSCNDDLVDRALHKVGADALPQAVALPLDAGAIPLALGVERLYDLPQFPCRAIARVGPHHVQVLLEVGELIDKQAHVKLLRPEKTMID